jgi:HAD superfamily hydrolase (TIGR01549 family)
MKSHMFKAVFFDWDLTLVRVLGDISTEERLTALLQQEGMPYTLVQVQEAVRKYHDDLRTGRIRRSGRYQTQRDIARYYQDILTRLNSPDTSWARMMSLYDAYSLLQYKPYEETRPALAALAATGVKLGVISNHSRLIRPRMEEMLREFIPPERIVISQEVGAHKPARTIYRRACARAQEDAADCIFVGDHLVVDAQGAVENGGFGLGLWLNRNGNGNGHGHGNGEKNTAVLPPNVVRITSLWQVLDYVG